MYITGKDKKILHKENVIVLGLKYRELTGKEEPAFNYEDYPMGGAQIYVENLKDLIEKAEQK